MKKNYESNIVALREDKFGSVIDSLQLELDNKHMSSEVHMLFSLEK